MAEQASSIQDDDAFLEACRYGEVSSVRQYLNSGGDANRTTDYGIFALDEASREGHLEIVKLLIENGASVNLSTQYGFPLQEACMEGHFDVVCELLISGADVNLKTKCNSALEEACIRNHLKVVQKLIEHRADVNLRTEYSFPLREACRKGHTDIVKELIKHGADVNMKTKYDSALEAASRNGHYETVCVLLEHKVNVNSSSEYSYALREATRKGYLNIVQKLLDTNAKMDLLPGLSSPVQDAIDIGHFDIVREFIEKKKAINKISLVDYTNKKITEAADEDEEDFQLLSRMYKIIEILTKQTKNEVKQKIEAALQAAPEEKKEMYRKCLDHYTRTLNEDSEDEDDDKILSEAFDRGSEKDYRIRVNFVGHLAAGKTSLMLQMLLEDFDPSKITSTNGIDLSVGNCCVDINSGLWYKEGWTSEQDMLHRVRVILHSAPLPPSTMDQEWKVKQVFEEDSEQPEDIAKDAPADQDTTNEPEQNDVVIAEPQEDQKNTKGKAKQKEENQSILIYTREELTTTKIVSTITDKERVKEILKKAKEMDSGRKENQAFVRGFDYAGQCVFYTVHQLFLSQRGVNIIVIDGSRNFNGYVDDEDCRQIGGKIRNKTAKEFFKFWAKSLRFSLQKHTQKQIIVVITHKDLVEDPTKLDEIEFEVKETIQEMKMTEMFVDEPFRINCNDKKDPETPKLRNKILEISKEFDDWGKKMPSRWLFLEDKLMKKKSDGNRIIKLDEVLRLNNSSTKPLPTHKEILLFLRTHHQLGKIMYYEDEGLRDLVILDPQWLIDSLKAVITAKCFWLEEFKGELKEFKKTGILRRTVMEEIWKKKDEKEKNRFFEFKDQIILFMVKLDLISNPKMYDEDGKNVTSPYFVVPCMLSSAPKDFLQNYRNEAKSKNIPLVFEFHDDFLPSSIVYRLLAACNMRYGIRGDSESTKKKASETITIHCDAAVFKVGESHYLILEYKGCYIIADVVSMWKETTDSGICQGVREFLDDTLQCIIAPHKSFMKYSVKVSCGKGVEFGDFGLLDWETVLKKTEEECEHHRPHPPHVVELQTIKRHWFVMRERRPSFSRRERPANIGIPTQHLLGRISRQMCPNNYTIEFQTHLELDLHDIQRLEFEQSRQELILRLLLFWLRKKNKKATITALEAIYSAGQSDTLDIQEMLAPRDEWRKELSEDILRQTLSTASDVELDKICDLVGSKYLPFGLELHFEEEKIDQYKSDFAKCHAITKYIITQWIAREGDEANWMVLGDALYEIGAGVGYILDRFQPQKSTEVKHV